MTITAIIEQNHEPASKAMSKKATDSHNTIKSDANVKRRASVYHRIHCSRALV